MTHEKSREMAVDPAAMLEEVRQLHEQAQQRSQEFMASVQGLQPLEKAEAWLRYVANEGFDFGAQEALVYLVSRGHDCTQLIREAVTEWKLAVKRTLEMCLVRLSDSNGGSGENKGTALGKTPSVEACDISKYSPLVLYNFWAGGDAVQDLTIDSTMLRTAEWCGIGGFDEWWHRLAEDLYRLTILGGIDDTVRLAFHLFSMCRSDYAIQLMPKALDRALDAIEISEDPQSPPWRRWVWSYSPPRQVDSLSYAITIAFANARLRPQRGSQLVDQAVDTLLKLQGVEGAWRCWTDDTEPSVESTAMAVHALMLNKPKGWRLAVTTARDWLWSVQHRSGCWIELGTPDSVYLTVLALDAIELASDGARVTFNLSRSCSSEVGGKAGEEVGPAMKKIRVLFLAANPADTQQLSLDEQIRLITEKIRASDCRDALELNSAWAVRADDLLQLLNAQRPHIVHFSGHGSAAGEILVVGRDGLSKPISTKAVRALFKTLRDNIRIVILDACYSLSQARALCAIIDCVIGMEGAIGDEAATVFTASFYRAIGFGRSVQEAYDQGIAALLLEGIPEDTTPRLLARRGIDPSQVYLIEKSR